MRTGAVCLIASLLHLGLMAGCTSRHAGVEPRELDAMLRAMTRSADDRRTGTITGNLYLLNPGIPSLLREHPVTLLPLSPGLEQAIAETGARFAKSRATLPPQELASAKRLLDGAIAAIRADGGEQWIRTTRTDKEEAGFAFTGIPEGRWLLVAELEARFSRLLWAVPVSVEAGKSTLQRLNDGNIWLDGLKP